MWEGTEEKGARRPGQPQSQGSRQSVEKAGRAGLLISAIPRGSPAALPWAERRPLCSSNMISNFRQTFEVPDICIM